MSWKPIGKPKIVKLSKALASRFAKMEAVPQDRPLNPRRIAIYNQIADRGEFRPVTWAECLCKETETIYRVNGKHTSVMADTREELPDMYILLETYEADTLQDVAHLYETFDSRTAARTNADILRSFCGCDPQLAELPHRLCAVAAHGIAYFSHQDSYVQTSSVARAENLIANVNFAIWLNNLIKEDKDRFLLRGPIVGAMFGTFRRCQSAAGQFWEMVRTGDCRPAKAPDRKLRDFLQSHSVQQGRGSKLARSTLPKEFFVKSIIAWNAWRRDESTDLKYYHEAKRKVPVCV